MVAKPEGSRKVPLLLAPAGAMAGIQLFGTRGIAKPPALDVRDDA